MSILQLTIAIPVRNEERNLASCLQAIGSDLASQVVVIDSGSTDATAAVTVRKDDAPAATQAATTILAASLAFSDGGGLIQTTSG